MKDKTPLSRLAELADALCRADRSTLAAALLSRLEVLPEAAPPDANPGGPAVRVKLAPAVHFVRKRIKCPRKACRKCAAGLFHGPYWYAYWKQAGSTRTTYIGKHLPEDINSTDEKDKKPLARLAELADELSRLDMSVREAKLRRRLVIIPEAAPDDATPAVRVKLLPAVNYHAIFIPCGSPGCLTCATGRGHGPYWYARWWEGGRRRSKYIGKFLPTEAANRKQD
jgi:hypothetical protein